MKHFFFFFLVTLSALLPGCQKKPPAAGVQHAKAPTQDSLKTALDTLVRAGDVGQIRDALHPLNTHLARDADQQVKSLTPAEKDTVQKIFRPTKESLANIDSSLFGILDACHLESSFLFRDAARTLEVPNAAPLQQARICFEWVLRQVRLHEQVDQGLPPSFVLRRSFGNGRDRALVFLSLLRQFQIEGCLVATESSRAASGPVLAGVLLEKNQQPALFLFDPCLGEPLRTSQGIATFNDLTAHPELWKTGGEVAKLDLFLASPLEALPARMRYLQDLLAKQDKVILFQDTRLAGDLAKVAGKPVQPWPNGPAPADALRRFLPMDKEDAGQQGGSDQTGRLARDYLQKIRLSAISRRFQEMRLQNPSDIPDPAPQILRKITEKLLTTFVIQPRDFLLRGQYDAMVKRIERMRTVLDTEEAARPLDEAEFQKQLADWRKRVREAYLALLVRKEADGQARVQALWEEDQYLANLLQVDSEVSPEHSEKRLLSLILIRACRDILGQQMSYLTASCWHEKAAQLQNSQSVLAAAGDVPGLADEKASAWRNARSAWMKYLNAYGLTARAVPGRLAEINKRWQRGDLENWLDLWEQFHLDLHATLAARLCLAEAQQHTQTSTPALTELLAELTALRKSGISKALNEAIEQGRRLPVLAQRLELLSHDWAPQGHLYWLEQSARDRQKKS